MKLADVDTKATEFSEEQLDAMVDILVKAKEIEADSALYAMVQKHMKGKVKSIKSVSDLRAKANEAEQKDMTAER